MWDSSRSRISRGDHARLQGVALRLATRYPPDWLERRGEQVVGAAVLGCFLLACLIALVWSPWWAYLVPVVLPPLISGVIPSCLLGREPGCPRWAHPKAIVDEQDVALIGAIVAALDRPLREQCLKHCPADSGTKFFSIWQALQPTGPDELR